MEGDLEHEPPVTHQRPCVISADGQVEQLKNKVK